MDEQKKLFTARRWHDNPAKGCTVRHGEPTPEEERIKIKKEFREILRKEGVLLDDEEDENDE